MTGPEINGTLRRPWRYSLLAHISDDEGNFDPEAWGRLTEKVAGMVVEAQAEAWDEGMEHGIGEFGKPLFDSDYACNPYRATEDQAAMAISAEGEQPMPPEWADAFESIDAVREDAAAWEDLHARSEEALEHVRKASNAAHARAGRAEAHADELEKAVDRVRALHTQDTSLLAPGEWCPGCGQSVPCSTIRALNEPKKGAGR